MSTHQIRILAVLLILVVVVTACSFGPPPSCGENIGGTADTVTFDQYFISMSLISQATGQTGPEGENGAEFTQGEALVIQLESKSEVSLRACVQPRYGGDKIPFDQTQVILEGQGTFDIGVFDPGPYVIRVIVDDTLVKNFPFEVK